MIKNKLKEFLSEFKKFKVEVILILDYKKRNYCKIFHSSAKVIASDSDIDEALKGTLMHFENLPICSKSCKSDTLEISHS